MSSEVLIIIGGVIALLYAWGIYQEDMNNDDHYGDD